jgi:hypothetical protein
MPCDKCPEGCAVQGSAPLPVVKPGLAGSLDDGLRIGHRLIAAGVPPAQHAPRNNAKASEAPWGMEQDVTFVVTSCARLDLLERTLDSFFEYNSAPIARYILTEDGGGASVLSVVEKYQAEFDVFVNEPPIGQIASIDLAYKSIATPYIFHCEDDWRFFRSGFIEESMALLDAFTNISMVLIRRRGQHPVSDLIYQDQGEIQNYQGIAFRYAPRLAHRHWLGYSFNPGLRRLSDYRRMGTFGHWGHEIDASIFFKRKGMTMAVLEEPACETTGWKRHVTDTVRSRNCRSYVRQQQRSLAHYTETMLSRLGSREVR